jgi:hypothetical protein
MICASCKRPFDDYDNGLFITCPSCRRPDKPSRRRKARRFSTWGRDRSGRTDEHRENTRETKFGVDR